MAQWKEYEQAVSAFVAALDPAASVRYDILLPDRHTNRPRQRDVWVETKIAGHFPVKILISCKRLKRRIHQGDMDAFHGELLSSSAQLGVLYSYSGFAESAIEKATDLGISCCRLYTNEAPEIPEFLNFTAYCWSSRVQTAISPKHSSFRTWGSVFEHKIETKNGNSLVIDVLERAFHDAERIEIEKAVREQRFPDTFGAQLRFPDGLNNGILLTVKGTWRVHRAKLDAYLVNGSYEFTTANFKGEIITPTIAVKEIDPGPGWELVDTVPEYGSGMLSVIRHGGEVKNALISNLATTTL